MHQSSDQVANAVVGASTLLFGLTLATTVQIVQIVAGVLSCIGIIAATTYHVMKIMEFRRDRNDE